MVGWSTATHLLSAAPQPTHQTRFIYYCGSVCVGMDCRAPTPMKLDAGSIKQIEAIVPHLLEGPCRPAPLSRGTWRPLAHGGTSSSRLRPLWSAQHAWFPDHQDSRSRHPQEQTQGVLSKKRATQPTSTNPSARARREGMHIPVVGANSGRQLPARHSPASPI